MKFYNNNVEVIIFSKLPADLSEKELIHWFITIVQPLIEEQQERIEPMHLINLTHTPAIYLS